MSFETSPRVPEPRITKPNSIAPLDIPGMRTAAVISGVKPSGQADLAVIDMGRPVTAAAVFTTNEFCAAPVTECRRRLAADPRARTIVINSGNANAMTGAQGVADTRTMLDRVEERIGGPALVLSTGVIGVPLPIDKVVAGIDQAADRLAPGNGGKVAQAILTTDTRTKTSTREVRLPAENADPERTVAISGIAKGSGMIHPNMATMLAVIATEVPLETGAAQEILENSVDGSFHCITVDGDTSTNDAVILLAGGAEMPVITRDSERGCLIERAICEVAEDLALAIVRDGEGATRLARITVQGARTDGQARRVAKSIACSSLVKTALAGGDPNWGRILSAAANAGANLEVDRLRLSLGGIAVFDAGSPISVDQEAVDHAFAAAEVDITLELGLGDHASTVYTSDLTKGYVEINSEYTT